MADAKKLCTICCREISPDAPVFSDLPMCVDCYEAFKALRLAIWHAVYYNVGPDALKGWKRKF